MSKLDTNIVNNIKMLSLDMIKEAGSGDAGLALSSSNIFYTLFAKHLKFDNKNPNWINRDRVIISNRLLPIMYSTLHMFGFNISIDSLKEFKKLNSKLLGYAKPEVEGIEVASNNLGDVITSSIGISLGERYLESLVKIENPKCNLINFNTFCICTYEEIMKGATYEALSYAGKEKLNKLVIIVVKDDIARDSSTKEVYTEDLEERFNSIGYELIPVKGNSINVIDEAIEEALDTKKPSIIVVSNTYAKDSLREGSNQFFNMPLTNDDMDNLRTKYKIDLPFNVNKEYYSELNKVIDKRLSKHLSKWNSLKEECLKDLKLKEIIEFLETKNVKVAFNAENIKLNDNYEEELNLGHSKIFNILASKSPFVLSLSDDNFIYTHCSISKSESMNINNPTGRNILFGGRSEAMGGIANGLASLGFKVFVSTPLINSNILRQSIKFSAANNLPVHYIFTQDTFTNTYGNYGYSCVDEINSLRLIPNLINFRPADINEVIGVYNILASYKKATTIILGSDKTKKIEGTNYKYVVAGAYRAKREKGEANGIIIATGSEVALAKRVAEELFPYGIDFRVVTMPSQELFRMQNDRYKYSLLPKELKTFVIEFGNNDLWREFATSEEYIFGLNKYSVSGTKEELLSYYDLDIDSIKAKIIELMKNN